MKLIFNKKFLEHNNPQHPENNTRLKYFKELEETVVENGEKYLSLAHTKRMIDAVKEASKRGAWLDGDTYTNEKSYEAACYAVGAAIKAAEDSAFALVRPPGHHATRDQSMGFCIFNNMGIVAKKLVSEGKRVFVLDIDLHHGNGTQDILLGEENAMFFSIHQSPMYPGTGQYPERNCVNIPMPYQTSDVGYISILEKKLKVELEKFDPDIVGVSAGFDSYCTDLDVLHPGVGFRITGKSYDVLKAILKPYKTFYLLEGGYSAESIRDGVNLLIKD